MVSIVTVPPAGWERIVSIVTVPPAGWEHMISIVTVPPAGWLWVRMLVGTNIFSLLQDMQSGSGADPAFYLKGTSIHYQWPGHVVSHFRPTTTEVRL